MYYLAFFAKCCTSIIHNLYFDIYDSATNPHDGHFEGQTSTVNNCRGCKIKQVQIMNKDNQLNSAPNHANKLSSMFHSCFEYIHFDSFRLFGLIRNEMWTSKSFNPPVTTHSLSQTISICTMKTPTSVSSPSWDTEVNAEKEVWQEQPVINAKLVLMYFVPSVANSLKLTPTQQLLACLLPKVTGMLQNMTFTAAQYSPSSKEQ